MLKEHGSEAAVKAAGGYRQQGKNYIVEDGDIIFFKVKFNLRCFVINVIMSRSSMLALVSPKERKRKRSKTEACCVDQNCDHHADQSTTCS